LPAEGGSVFYLMLNKSKGAASMKNSFSRIIIRASFLSVFLSAAIIGCSGGGGGGVSSGINYTGITSQAVIDENNAVDITVETYAGGEIASNLAVLGAVSENSNSAQSPRFLNIAVYFQDVILNIEGSVIQNTAYVGAVVSESDAISGGCGGNFSYNLTADDQSGNFNGSLSFNNFCEQEFTANGSMNLAGNINVNTGGINYFEMTFTDIVMTSGQESISMNGSIDLNLQSTPMRMTMSFVFQDNNLNKTYRYEDFVYEYAEGGGFVDITVTGRFYHHDYGYVILSTDSPLRFNGNDAWPSSGTIIATGASGTKARLNVINSSSFFVDADTDGNGSYDYDSGSIAWPSIL
jgi:hypothetical protein